MLVVARERIAGDVVDDGRIGVRAHDQVDQGALPCLFEDFLEGLDRNLDVDGIESLAVDHDRHSDEPRGGNNSS